MSIFWTNKGDDWIKKRNAFINAQLGPDPGQMNLTPDVYNPEIDRQSAEWQKARDQKEEEWFASLPPDQAKQAYDAFAARNSHFDKSFKIGRGLALGIIGAAAGGAGLQALGGAGLSGGAGTAATVPSQALSGGSMLSGSGMTAAGATVPAAAAVPAAATSLAANSTLPAFDTGVGGLFGSQTAIDSALASTATGLGSTAGLGGAPLMGMGGISAPQIGGGLFNFAPAALDTLGLDGAVELTASNPAANAAASTPAAPPAVPPVSSGGGLLSSVGTAAGGVADWIAKNPGLASLLGGALATAGSSGGSSTPTQPQSFAKQPGLLMGTMQKPQLMQSPGTLSPLGQGGYQNSGLARFGATGGLFSPTQYQPQNYGWNK